MDRVFFNYSHASNELSYTEEQVLKLTLGPMAIVRSRPVPSRALDVDEYTFGFEKTVFDSLGSIQLRMPITSDLSLPAWPFPDDGSEIGGNGGTVGNLTLAGKGLLYRSLVLSAVAGLAVTVPTGSDTFISDTGAEVVRVYNRAVHLAPFVGVLGTPNDDFFYSFW